jgi:hypothetical protein
MTQLKRRPAKGGGASLSMIMAATPLPVDGIFIAQRRFEVPRPFPRGPY